MNRKRKLLKNLVNLLEDNDERPTKRRAIYSSSSDSEEEEKRPKRSRIRKISSSSESEKENDMNILEIIGESPKEENLININSNLSTVWNNILKKGLDKEQSKLIEESIPKMKNCSVTPPDLNTEIANILNSNAKGRDTKIKNKQARIGLIINLLNKVLIKEMTKGNEAQIKDISDSIKLLCDFHHKESINRRSIVLPVLNKELKTSLVETPITEQLFGTDIHKVLKNNKELEKSGKDLKRPSNFPKPLNYWGPSTSQTPCLGGQQYSQQKRPTHQFKPVRQFTPTQRAPAPGHPRLHQNYPVRMPSNRQWEQYRNIRGKQSRNRR